MASYTRKQIVTFISIVCLIFATAIAGYAACRANRLSVPISDTLTGFATALPVISGILLECGYDLTRRKERLAHMQRGEIQRPPFVIVANFVIFIYSTVVITLLGTHVGPSSELDCGLRKQWQSLFRIKDSSSIRAIQDQYNCCGFASPTDMAWPFPDKSHKPGACMELSVGRTESCMGPWKAEEQHVAGLLLGAVGLVVIWAFTIVVVPTQRESWLHRIAPEQISDFIAREEHGNTGERRRINYLPDTNQYADRFQEEDDETTPLSPETRRALEAGKAQVGTGLPGNVAMDAPATEEWARG